MFSGKIYIVFAITGLAVAGLFLPKSSEKRVSSKEKQKGVCWVGQPREITAAEIKSAKECGVSWISQTPFGWQRNASDTLIRAETLSQTPWWGESKQGIAVTTALAREHSISTLLKPHLWIRDSWPGEIEMRSEEEWSSWFRQYESFIVPYAALADSIGIEIFCIGTELHKTVRRQEWITLIKKIRSVYKGKLTYAANFSGEFEDVPFWSELDYIGVQAYFPLTSMEKPGLPSLLSGWRDPIRRIEKVHQKFDKPVIFTELGYKSTADAAVEPWRWPEKAEIISMETQSNCYEAFFRVVWPLDWIEGVYFWKWYPHSPRHSTEADFTPQGKPAEEVMKSWFAK